MAIDTKKETKPQPKRNVWYYLIMTLLYGYTVLVIYGIIYIVIRAVQNAR